MKNFELHKFDKNLLETIKKVGYQSLSLRDLEDAIIITYNTPKTTMLKKWEEMDKRFNVLEPGVYILYAMQKHGAKGRADKFYINHGNVDATKYLEEKPKPVAEKKEADHVLTYTEALKNINSIATLTAENTRLTKELETANKIIAELEEEIKELEESELSEAPAPGFNITDFTTAVLPALDRYFDIKEKQQNLSEKELFLKFQKAGMYPNKNGNAKRPTNRGAQREENIYPDLNDEQALNTFIDELDKLSEEDLQKALQVISRENPNLYNICIDELYTTEEEEEEEQQ